ncbi:glycine N-methyltransferase isoform X3 [Symphalangus syndactylus]|uniref:glycine N-methyltransferase isoform X3 n=1 Tax=Symphalangus syndactylus TaxID=9590 RepID=UPI0024417B65|nr:glycine N-methyltransferase isoform X1 [Symphalangus syndactylus]
MAASPGGAVPALDLPLLRMTPGPGKMILSWSSLHLCVSRTDVPPVKGADMLMPAFAGNCPVLPAWCSALWISADGVAISLLPPFLAPLAFSSRPRVDSIMLVEEGFSVTSVDASDKMLKYALKERWNRRHEPAFDKWVIEEANWMTLDKDVPQSAEGGFDAVICLGNSFAHLPDCKGDQSEHRLALKNIASMVRAGGLLVIDHRNYDHILSTGCAPPGKNIYYKSDLTKDVTTSVLTVNNKAHMVTLDYTVQVPGAGQDGSPGLSKFRLSYYPHCLASFTKLLQAAFGGKCQHSVLGDFKPYKPGQAYVPCYFIHVLKRTD